MRKANGPNKKFVTHLMAMPLRGCDKSSKPNYFLTLPMLACKKSLGNDVPGWDAVLLLHIRPPSLGRSIFEGRTLTAAIVCIYYRLHTFKQPPVNCPREAQHGTSRCYFLQAAKMRCIKGRGFLNVFPTPHDTQRKSFKVSVLIS